MRLGEMATRVVVVAGLLAACSADDGTKASSDGGAQDPPAADDPRTDEARAADQAAAEAIGLTLADFPPGWESTPADEEPEDSEELDADLAKCLGIDESELDGNNPEAASPTFASSNDEEVESLITFTPSPEDAIRSLEIRRGEKLPECYADAIRSVIADGFANPKEGEEPPDDLEVGDPSANPISFPALGDESLAFRIIVPFSASGLDIDLYLDLVAVRVGRVGVTMYFQSVFSPFSSEEAERLTRLVVDRVPAGA